MISLFTDFHMFENLQEIVLTLKTKQIHYSYENSLFIRPRKHG